MRVRWILPAAVAGILLLCTGAAATAQGFPGYAALQAPAGQMATLPQYRVEPVPPSPYVVHGFPATGYAAPGHATPGFPAYGSSFDRRVEQLQPGRLVPTPNQFNGPAPGRTMHPDRLSQVEAELEMLKSAMAQRSYYGAGGRIQSSYAPLRTGFYADMAFVFARPSFTDASNFGIYDAPQDLSTAGSFDYDYELAPRVWLGYVGPDGRGVRARYWQFEHSGRARSLTQTDPNIFYGADWIHPWGMITAMTTGVGDVMNITNSLKAQALDLEVTQTLNFCRAEIMLGAGLRYALLEKEFDAVIPGVDFLTARHDFEGVGPTISMDVRLPIDCYGCWSLYGGCRYSILFGESWAYGENGSDPFNYTLDEVLSIGEIEIGVEWTRSVSRWGLFVVRAGYEGQVWYEAGSPSNVGGDLGFEGINVKLGFIR